MPCTICQHPKRPEIDQTLITGSATMAALSQEYGLSTSGLHRHKAHLQTKVNRAKDRLQDNLLLGYIFWLSQALEMTMQTAQTAQAEGNVNLILRAVSQSIRLISIILKQDLPLDDGVVYAILTSPQWTAEASLLPHDPNIMALSRQSLARTLSSPCPEPAAPAASAVSPQELDQLHQLFSLPATPPAPSAQPSQCREKSGKSPGKTSFRKDNCQNNQEDELFEKLSRLMDSPQLFRNLSPGTENSKLETLFQPRDKSGKIPEKNPSAAYLSKQSLIDSQYEKNTGKCVPTNLTRPAPAASVSRVDTAP